MGFFERLSRSWDLVKASAAVLRDDKSLLVFPVIAVVAAIAVAALMFIPAYRFGWLVEHERGHALPSAYVWGFALYVIEYFIVLFFNAALVGAVMLRLEGKPGTVGDGLAIASAKVGTIFVYSLIAATVGMLLHAIAERLGFIGRLVTSVLGFAWGLATFLVMPVLVARNVSPIDAIQESAALLRRTWGENLLGSASIGLVFGVIFAAVFFVGGGLAAFLISHDLRPEGLVLVFAAVVAGLLLFLVQSALTGIFSVALYRYATTGQGPTVFSPDLLAGAFRPKAA